jgi:hypothetical protein
MIPILIIVATLIFVLFVSMLIYYKKTGKKHEPDYYTMYILGITWTPLGIIFATTMNNPAFLGIGIVLLIAGLANKDKWKKQPKLNRKQQKWTRGALIFGLLLLSFLVGVFMVLKYVF